MPFPNRPHPRLLSWDTDTEDKAAGDEAAILAQILFMGDKLPYPFDRGRFDVALGRTPGQPIMNATGMRLILDALPTLRIESYGPHRIEDRFKPRTAQRTLAALGMAPEAIRRYMTSELYNRHRERFEEFRNLADKAGRRYKLNEVVRDSFRRTQGHLCNGAVIVTSPAAQPSQLLMLVRGISGDPGDAVGVYSPTRGFTPHASLKALTKNGTLDLNGQGAVAYILG